MASDIAPREIMARPAFMDERGELFHFEIHPVSAEEAGRRLLIVQRLLSEARSYAGYLETMLREHIESVPGRTELRVAETVWQLKPDYEWVINDPQALYGALTAARERGEVTQAEMDAAIRLEVSARANNSRLNALAKRLPEIDLHRTRTETPAKLRIRSEK